MKWYFLICNSQQITSFHNFEEVMKPTNQRAVFHALLSLVIFVLGVSNRVEINFCALAQDRGYKRYKIWEGIIKIQEIGSLSDIRWFLWYGRWSEFSLSRRYLKNIFISFLWVIRQEDLQERKTRLYLKDNWNYQSLSLLKSLLLCWRVFLRRIPVKEKSNRK